MGLYKYLRQTLKEDTVIKKQRLLLWRKEPAILRIERPTRLDRARALGYKAKEGYVLVRVRVKRGGKMRERFKGGRRSKTMRRRKVLRLNYQRISEQRVNDKYVNCEVLNSYPVGEDGLYAWYEIILVDSHNPHIVKDKRINWIGHNAQRGRVYRGLTKSGRQARGLNNKGRGAEQFRKSKTKQRKKRLLHP